MSSFPLLSSLKRALPRALVYGVGATALNIGLNNLGCDAVAEFKPLDETRSNQVKKIAREMGITSDISYRAIDNGSSGALSGYPFDKSVIVLTPDANDFLVAHELTHIKKKHSFKGSLSLGVVAAASVCAKRMAVPSLGKFRGSLVGAATTATLLAARLLLLKSYEKEIDIHASNYVNKDDIAKAIQKFQEVELTNHLFISDQVRKKMVDYPSQQNNMIALTKFILNTVDSYPALNKRIDYLTEIYYKKIENAPFPIKITTHDSSEEGLSLRESLAVVEIIRNSKEKATLVNIESITLKRDVQKDNLSFNTANGSQPIDYDVDPVKIDLYFNSGKPFEVLATLVEEAVNNPEFTLFSVVVSSTLTWEWETEEQKKLIEKLREVAPDYDWDNARILKENETLNIKVFKIT